MMAMRRLLPWLVGLETLIVAGLLALRLNSTAPAPPPVELYNDAPAGRELLALPDRFLFDSAAKWRTLGEAYLAFGYFSKGDACLRQAGKLDPSSADVAFAHGFCLERLGEIEGAIEQFRRVIGLGALRLEADAWYHLGRNHLRLEHPDEAALAFARAGEEHWPSLYQRAKLLVRAGEIGEAKPLLAQLLSEHPRDLHVLQLHEQALRAEGVAVDPLEHEGLERASATIELDDAPDFLPKIREQFGLARDVARVNQLQSAGRLSAAAALLQDLVESDTRWPNRYLQLLLDAAALELEAGDAAQGSRFVERQFENYRYPLPRAWELRGDVAYAVQDLDRARDAWSRAAGMQRRAALEEKLARLAEQEKDSDAARRHRALWWTFTGIDLFRSDRLEEARNVLQQGADADAAIPDLWFYLGETERLLGHPQEAESAFRRCLKLHPGHSRVRLRLESAL
ncbi:MAG: tetratricopeptide repeat protein [Planctomycetales bacterium]